MRDKEEGREESEITGRTRLSGRDFLLYGSGRALAGNLFHAVKPPPPEPRAMASIQDRKAVIQTIN